MYHSWKKLKIEPFSYSMINKIYSFNYKSILSYCLPFEVFFYTKYYRNSSYFYCWENFIDSHISKNIIKNIFCGFLWDKTFTSSLGSKITWCILERCNANQTTFETSSCTLIPKKHHISSKYLIHSTLIYYLIWFSLFLIYIVV